MADFAWREIKARFQLQRGLEFGPALRFALGDAIDEGYVLVCVGGLGEFEALAVGGVLQFGQGEVVAAFLLVRQALRVARLGFVVAGARLAVGQGVRFVGAGAQQRGAGQGE